MDTARSIVALVLLVVSPWLLFWFAVHPIARYWRRLGPVRVYTLVGTPLVAGGVRLYMVRQRVLAIEYGTHVPLLALGLVCLIAATALRVWVQRHLSARMMSGMPELGADRPGENVLLTEGPYAHMRHPRYAQLTLAVIGWALVANYLAIHLLALLTGPVLYLTAILEERELRERFGDAYSDYRRRVPRLFPWFRRVHHDA